MAQPSSRDLVDTARKAGYTVAHIEQLRPNRWLLTLGEPSGNVTLAMIQARPLIGSADVQDLAELVLLRRATQGLLVAYGGSFSTAAQQTLHEIGDSRLRLCNSLPQVGGNGSTSDARETTDLRRVRAATQS